jgi:hypothetical protein
VRRWMALLAAVVTSLCVFGVDAARAQGLIERLTMPGPVVEGHAKFEGECGKCHDAFARSTQPTLCLNCHTDIVADRERRVGYHGKQVEARTRDCRACHTEHKGRDADISGLDQQRFDHGLTEYPLTGAHAKADCASCHAPKKSHRKTPSDCAACHAKADPHRGRLGDRCETCHSTSGWHDLAPFDHAKTRFPLEGAHKDVVCKTCHAGEAYKDLPRACVSCHLIQDVHGRKYGDKCDSCHDVVRWKEVKFDHSQTKFPLHGAHASVKCEACHTGDLYAQKLGSECVSCHRQADPHVGQLGDRCERCHNDSDWRRDIRFSHNETHFPLLGAHVTTLCENCHATKRYVDAPTSCDKCHQDTVHEGRLGAAPQCGLCHDSVAWKRWRYDHARNTRFPLTGAHQRTVCEKCHTARNPANLRLPMACESCHNDYHRGALGRQPDCASCHNTVAWPQWRFDHAGRANYPLTGAHLKLTCEKCHTAVNAASLKIPAECVSCHRKDNPHGLAFGLSCERCHDALGWRHLVIRQ